MPYARRGRGRPGIARPGHDVPGPKVRRAAPGRRYAPVGAAGAPAVDGVRAVSTGLVLEREPLDGALPVGAPAPAPRARPLRGVVVGAAVGGVVLLARETGALVGLPAVLALAALVLAVPTSRHLSRRVLLGGTVVLGWAPVLWWLPLAPGGVDRATAALALLAGGLAGWGAAGASPRDRLRRIVPRRRLVDVLPLGAATLAGLLALRWVPGTAEGALGVLTRGWDHSAHVNMAMTIRRTGGVMDLLGAAPGGEEWAYSPYPQGYHALTAGVMDLLGGPAVASPADELVLYLRAMALLAAVGVLVAVAAVTALPGVDARPALAVVLASAAGAVTVLGPMGRMTADGFPNFSLACVLLWVLPVLVVLLDRVPVPLLVLALGGVVVGVAHNWVLLLALVAPAVVPALLPATRTRWRGSRREWALVGAIVVATAGALAYALVLVSGLRLAEVLVIGGGVEVPSPLHVVVPAVLGVCVPLVAARRASSPARGRRLRARLLAVVPAVGTLVAVGIAAFQVSQGVGLSYYFHKFTVALAVIGAACAVVALGVVLASRRPTTPRRAWSVALVAGAVLSQVFGPTPPLSALRAATPSPGLTAGGALAIAADAHHPGLDALLSAASAGPPGTAGLVHGVYVQGEVPGGIHPTAAAQWYYALTGTWTTEGNVAAGLAASSADVVEAARVVLTSDPRALVVVPDGELARVRAALPEWADRVTAR